MLPDAPVLLELLFFGITAACLLLLYNALETISKKTATVAITFLVVWSMMQSALADNGFYRDYQTMPPRLFVYGLFPILSVISFVLIYPATRARLLQVCLEGLTWIHVIRIPVELSLLWLFVQKAVPQAMTFDGMKFDIVAGVTAPLVAIFGIRHRKLSRKLLLAWNLVSLFLLLNIIIMSVLSAPLPFQVFGMEQPNIAVFYFPYALLPTVILPVVLFAQVLSIIKLCSRKKNAIYCRKPFKLAYQGR